MAERQQRQGMEFPERFAWPHIVLVHGGQITGYGFGAFELARLGLGGIPGTLAEFHQNISWGVLYGLENAALLASSVALLREVGGHALSGFLEAYYNVRGGGRHFRRVRGLHQD